jgi:hypothetical protein
MLSITIKYFSIYIDTSINTEIFFYRKSTSGYTTHFKLSFHFSKYQAKLEILLGKYPSYPVKTKIRKVNFLMNFVCASAQKIEQKFLFEACLQEKCAHGTNGIFYNWSVQLVIELNEIVIIEILQLRIIQFLL